MAACRPCAGWHWTSPAARQSLLGPNGAGKSTTVGMMLGLVRPDTGVVEVCGRGLRRAVAEGRIATMLQDAGMMPGVTVGELVGLGHRGYRDALPTGEALELAGLTGLARRRVDKLSGGQAQRLRFALAVVANPEILTSYRLHRCLRAPIRPSRRMPVLDQGGSSPTHMPD